MDRDEIRLQWQPASPRLCDGGVDHYTVQYSLVGGNTTSLNVTGTSVLLSNLEAGATYDIVVFAVNRMGPSLPSSLLSVNISGVYVCVCVCMCVCVCVCVCRCVCVCWCVGVSDSVGVDLL